MRARLALLFLVSTAAIGSAQAPGALTPKDVDAIRAASLAAADAAQKKDWARWLAIFSDDIVNMPPNGPAIEGRAGIEAFLRGFPPFKDLKVEPLEIQGRGDLAYVRGRYSLVLVLPGEPERREVGKFIEIWRKQADGSWKLTRDISNSDLPATAPGARR